MPVTQVSLATTPYRIGSPAGIVAALAAAPVLAPGTPAKYRNIHTIYPTVAGRITVATAAPTPQMVLTTVAGTHSATGDGIYLKYFDEEITSIRLPCPAPAGMTVFFTDNLSGCKFYVDSIQGSNDLIAYHANTHQHTAGGNADADVQTPAAAAILDAMHLAAQADYAPLVLNNVADCNMPTYFGSGGMEERRKALQGRTDPLSGGNPKFMGLCSIFGFPVGGSWQFWFQTCGDVGYQRPIGKAEALFTGHWTTLKKLATEGKKHAASYATMKVFAYQRIL
jgi:hypothetical protein